MPFTAAQLEERRQFLGASECGAALGLSPFFSQVDLYLDKIGEGTPIEETIPMMVGNALEPVTLTLFERESHMTVGLRQQVFIDPVCPWRRCTVDGIADDDWIVEAKTSGDFRGWGESDDDVPTHYLYNAMHSLACIPSAPGVHLPVLVGGRTFRVYALPRDKELIDLVREGESKFMQHVLTRVPPQPRTMDDTRALYPRSSGTAVIATPDIEQAALRIAKHKAGVKQLEKMIEADMVHVTSFMKTAGELRRLSLTGTDGSALATWNSAERRTLDLDFIRERYPAIAQEAVKVTPTRTYLNKVKVTL